MTRREVSEGVPEEVRARLRAAAGAHRPDRARMLARIERGRAAGDRPGPGNAPRPRGGWVRVAGAPAADRRGLARPGTADPGTRSAGRAGRPAVVRRRGR
ncbi:hypothetical protein [Streptomyces shenzhenensis]|uniref:hypothetical protein n=1 Tax=Streptomyces shenzhenensis TaxID=943815 RepID=UPI003F5421E1